MLKIESLEKKYVVGKKDVPVLKDVSVEINEGDFVMIMGESGSGKSTFLNCISTLDSPNEGVVSFEGSVRTVYILLLRFVSLCGV